MFDPDFDENDIGREIENQEHQELLDELMMTDEQFMEDVDKFNSEFSAGSDTHL